MFFKGDSSVFQTSSKVAYISAPLYTFFFIRTSKIQVRLPMFLGFWNSSIFSVLNPLSPGGGPKDPQLSKF